MSPAWRAGGPEDDPSDGVAATGLRMPYGPWRRWVRALRSHHRRRRADDDSGDRVYLAYGFTLLALVYGPVLWTAVAQAGVPLGTGGTTSAPAALVATGAALLGVASVGGVLAARLGVPVWLSATEAAYALGGVWDPRVVLWRRGVVLVLGVAGVAALLGSALAAGASDAADGPGGPRGVLVWAGCAAGLGQLPLALAVAAQCPRWRFAARTVAVVVAVAGAFVAADAGSVAGTVSGAPAEVAVPGVVVGVSVAVAVVGAWLVLGVLPLHLDVDAVASAWGRTVATGAALSGGDATGVRTVAGTTALRARGRSYRPVLLRHLPIVARDLLGLRRRPGPVLAAVLAGAVGVVLVAVAAAGGPGAVLSAVGGGLVLYAASATWAGGLRDMAEQSVPAGLLPGGPRRAVLGHLPVPVLLAVVAGGLGLLAARPFVPVDGSAVVLGTSALVAVLGVRLWVAGATQAPPELSTPMAGPTGDLSVVMVVGWFLRGWLTVVGLAWLLARFGAGSAPTVVVVALWLAVTGVRRLQRS
ncbi:hypothetical protein [Isoptericola haloaureus]|uniref:ABC-2 type transport system permease protein n=1 Tax=Isoptericola haloaureus TaxID=1542902 RepID=A0ABU7Z8D0_9MICO